MTNALNTAANLAKNGARVINLGPTATYYLAEQVAGKRVALAAYIGATVLDWTVPCLPFGSALGIIGFGSVFAARKVSQLRGKQHTEAKAVDTIAAS